MISDAKCTNQQCNVCFDNLPSHHCERCSFVICNTCKLAMSQLKIDTKCAQCRKEEPWLVSYENNTLSNDIDISNVEVHIYEKEFNIFYYFKTLYYILFTFGLFVLFGYIYTTINGNSKKINHVDVEIQIIYYLISGFLVCLFLLTIFALISFVIVIFCCKKERNLERRIYTL